MTNAFDTAATEAGEAPADASTTQVLAIGDPLSGEIGARGDADWYRVTLEGGYSYYATVSSGDAPGALADPEVALYDADSVREEFQSLVGQDAVIAFTPDAGGTDGFIAASGRGFNAVGTYTVTLAREIIADATTPETISVGGNRTGRIDYRNDVDWYEVTLEAGYEYLFTLTADTDPDGFTLPSLTLYDADSRGLADRSPTTPLIGGTVLGETIETTGTFYVAAGNRNGNTNFDYTLSVVRDVAEGVATRTALAPDDRVRGAVDDRLDEDWYRVDAAAGTAYTFRLESRGPDGTENPWLVLHDASGDVLEADLGSRDEPAILTWTSDADTTLFLSAEDRFEDTGAYLLTMQGPLRGTGGPDRIVGTEGDDDIAGFGGADFVVANDGADTVASGPGNDQIFAGAGDFGDDRFLGGDGDDVIGGGRGNDTLNGDAGNDVVFGGSGDDLIMGGGGGDIAWAGLGADRVYGNAGNDVIGGGNANDLISGGAGRDTLYGGADAGRDTLNGGAQADILFGGAGNDILRGGDGGDVIYNGAGSDRVEAGAGDDVVWGGGGADILGGGAGRDVFAFVAGNGTDTIRDFEDGLDLISVGSGADSFAGLTIIERNGDARIAFADVVIVLDGVAASDLTALDFSFA